MKTRVWKFIGTWSGIVYATKEPGDYWYYWYPIMYDWEIAELLDLPMDAQLVTFFELAWNNIPDFLLTEES